MSSYEELVVDRGLDAVWSTFRDELAEHLAGDGLDDEVVLTSDVRDPEVPYLRITRSGSGWRVALMAEATPRPPYALDRAGRDRLRALGFRLRSGEPTLLVPDQLVDQVAHVAVTVARDLWGVLLPALLETSGFVVEFEEVVPDPVAAEPPAVPDLLRPTGRTEVAYWTDRVLGDLFGHPPFKDEDGDVPISGDRGGRAMLRVHETGEVVTVWTVLARQVRFRKAHRAADRLSFAHPGVRFFLADDRLIAAVDVHSRPVFAPEQVTAAVRRISAVSRRESGLEIELRRRRAPVPQSDLDGPLMMLFAGIWTKDVDAEALALELAQGEPEVLRRWCREAQIVAKEFAVIDDMSSTQRHAAERTASKWRRVARVANRVARALESEDAA